MGLIQVLPPRLVNRIAAGECVERPASVVKELVENALDAGAQNIDITLLDGGRELIRVADDGLGMDAEDLRLSVQPHATSKIREDDDLFNIHTMGFRGEALPSIGSVSRLEIVTRSRESDAALRLRVDAGRCGDVEPCAGAPGTVVEVRDLFYCVPARRKFLRTNQTEMGHVTEQLARIALAHPGVGFSLQHQGRVVHDLTPTEDPRKRLADFFGHDLADVLLPIRRGGSGVLIEGWVAPPKESRGSAKWEYVFVNGRYVRDRFISHAIKSAYRSLIDPSRYPVTFIFVTIEPELVDVNVHPTKTEVRWRDSNYIHGQVLAALRDQFLRTNLDHGLQARSAGEQEQYRERVRQAMVDFFTRQGGRAEGSRPRQYQFDPPGARPAEGDETSAARADAPETARPGPDPARPSAWPPAAPPGPSSEPGQQPAPILGPEPPVPGVEVTDDAGTNGRTRRAIQVHNAFLVVETDDGLVIIDQHALHERILYEEINRRMTSRSLESQRLLLPEAYSVPADRIEALETHADTLARIGVELTQSGPHSVTLHAFPSLLQRLDRERFVRDLLDLLAERGSRPDTESLIHELVDMMACKAAIKAGDPLGDEEIAALLARRTLAERSSHCPHGRPTTLHFTLRDLEKQFKRR